MSQAVVLARGPGIEHFDPKEWLGAETFGVNDVSRFHRVSRLVTVDDPWLITRESNPDMTDEAWQRIQYTKTCNPFRWYMPGEKAKSHPIHKKWCYVPIELVAYQDWEYGNISILPQSIMSVFTATALALAYGYKQVVVFGVHVYGHPAHEPRMAEILDAWSWLEDQARNNNQSIFIGHEGSALNEVLPLYKEQIA